MSNGMITMMASGCSAISGANGWSWKLICRRLEDQIIKASKDKKLSARAKTRKMRKLFLELSGAQYGRWTE